MNLALGKLGPNEPFKYLATSIGTMALFNMRVKDLQALEDDIAGPLADITPDQFARRTAKFIAFPEADIQGTDGRPEVPLLSDEQIDDLSRDDLENIAQAYIENNVYLYKKLDFRREQDKNGKSVLHAEYGEDKYPQNEGESFVDYLYRLETFRQAEETKRINDLRKKFSAFSTPLQENIAKNLTFGSTLQNIGKPPFVAHRGISGLVDHMPDFAEIHRRNEEARLKPFNRLEDRLEELKQVIGQALEFSVESNSIQTQIAAELKSGGDRTERHASQNLKISLLIVLISVIGLMSPFLVAYYSVSVQESRGAQVQGATDKLSTSIDRLGTSIANRDKLFIERLKQLELENKNLRRQLSELKSKTERLATDGQVSDRRKN